MLAVQPNFEQMAKLIFAIVDSPDQFISADELKVFVKNILQEDLALSDIQKNFVCFFRRHFSLV